MAERKRPAPAPQTTPDATDPAFQEGLVERVGAVRSLGGITPRTTAPEGKNPFGKELPLFVTSAWPA